MGFQQSNIISELCSAPFLDILATVIREALIFPLYWGLEENMSFETFNDETLVSISSFQTKHQNFLNNILATQDNLNRMSQYFGKFREADECSFSDI